MLSGVLCEQKHVYKLGMWGCKMIVHHTAAAVTTAECVMCVSDGWLRIPEGPSGRLACKAEADHASAHCRFPRSSCTACSAAYRLGIPAGLSWQRDPSGRGGSNQQWHRPHLHDINNNNHVPHSMYYCIDWKDAELTESLVCVCAIMLQLLGVQACLGWM